MFAKLNSEQKAIVKYPQIQNTLILAVPGAGKTLVMVLRIFYMIKFLGCAPKDFLVLTFTSNAAREIQRRLHHYVEVPIVSATFHAIAKKWLNLEDDVYHVDEYQYLFYDALKTQKFPPKYIFVDEYQDINEIQFQILKALYQNANMITVVGDENQNIYEFRGSNVKYIRHFTEDFPDVKEFYLSINYRSTPSIVALANAILKGSLGERRATSYITDSKDRKPIICHHYNIYRALNWLLPDIKKALSCGVKPESIAILSCNNYLLHFTECRLHSMGIGTIYLSGDMYQRDLQPDKIVLSTIHGSKGLEWDRVYILGLHNKHFPDERYKDLERMRRLLFVAVTRAKSELILFNSSLCPSIFISELPTTLFQCVGQFPNVLPFIPKIETVKRLGVSQAVRNLTGKDYQFLKTILPEYKPQIQRLGQSGKTQCLQKIHEHHLYPEFGIFMEYLARRMLFPIHPHLIKQREESVHKCLYEPAYKTRLSGETRKLMESAFQRYYDVSLTWQNCLLDIWRLSWAPSLLAGKQRVSQLIITVEDLQEGLALYKGMESRLQNWTSKVEYHVSFETETKKTKIQGEVDFLVGPQIVDLKCEWNPQPMNAFMDFIQLLLYSSLARRQGVAIHSVAIFNPIHDRYIIWNIHGWRQDPRLLTYIETHCAR